MSGELAATRFMIMNGKGQALSQTTHDFVNIKSGGHLWHKPSTVKRYLSYKGIKSDPNIRIVIWHPVTSMSPEEFLNAYNQ